MRQVLRSKRFLAADRANLDLGEITTGDAHLLREARLLVPVDVQALYVPTGGSEPMVRLPMLVANVGDQPVDDVEAGLPDPFDAGTPRPAGVHLHWAMPDALLRGTLRTVEDGSANRLALPPLPDRWLVLRIVLPLNGSTPVLSGWVLEADRAVAVPLAEWSEGSAASTAAKAAGAEIKRGDLTGTVGGALSWSGVYDAVLNRFAFHDPLADLATLAPGGIDEDCATYIVAGWWSDPSLDPLDKARSSGSLHEMLLALRWRLLHEWGDATWAQQQRQAEDDLRHALGLQSGTRFGAKRPAGKGAAAKTAAAAAGAAAASATAFTPVGKTFLKADATPQHSAFVADAGRRGLTVAAIGLSSDGLARFRRLGFHGHYTGDEAIVHPAAFSLDGRAIRKVRQSVFMLNGSRIVSRCGTWRGLGAGGRGGLDRRRFREDRGPCEASRWRLGGLNTVYRKQAKRSIEASKADRADTLQWTPSAHLHASYGLTNGPLGKRLRGQ